MPAELNFQDHCDLSAPFQNFSVFRTNDLFQYLSGLLPFSLIERVIKSHLIDHLTSNNLIIPHQSAYCKHQFTETALLYIHDHFINTTGSQKVLCLCLLDLSTASDTIDHNILITRLSCFGIQALF